MGDGDYGVEAMSITPRIGWFDRMVCLHPGFRRYLYVLKALVSKSK